MEEPTGRWENLEIRKIRKTRDRDNLNDWKINNQKKIKKE